MGNKLNAHCPTNEATQLLSDELLGTGSDVYCPSGPLMLRGASFRWCSATALPLKRSVASLTTTRLLFLPPSTRHFTSFFPGSARTLSSSASPQVKPAPRKKTKTIRQVEIEHNKLLGHYDEKEDLPEQSKKLQSKKVRAICAAESYDLTSLHQQLLTEYPDCQLFADEVIRFSPQGKECFIFDMGAIVAWDMSQGEIDALREKYQSFEVSSIPQKEYDEIDFLLEDTKQLSHLHDQHEPTLIIATDQSLTNIYLDKLAFSHGVANSVKLAVLENQLDIFVDSIKHLPIVLKNGQRLQLTRTQSLSKLGELLQFRAVLNLHSGLIETPDLYWNYSKLEGHFRSISNEFEIKQRVDALNKKLDYANDIAELLKGYLSERHSLKLEWAIIILIAVEVGFELLHFAERVM
jgi:required for meiotic nuclear division protein 1